MEQKGPCRARVVPHLLGSPEMPVMYGIKRPAENADFHNLAKTTKAGIVFERIFLPTVE